MEGGKPYVDEENGCDANAVVGEKVSGLEAMGSPSDQNMDRDGRPIVA